MTAFSAQLAEGTGMPAIAQCPMPTPPHSINTLHSSYPAPPPIPKQVWCLRKWYFYFRRNTEFLMPYTEFCEVSRNSADFLCKIWRNFCKIISTFLHFRANEKNIFVQTLTVYHQLRVCDSEALLPLCSLQTV
jgi:hypothetical protein